MNPTSLTIATVSSLLLCALPLGCSGADAAAPAEGASAISSYPDALGVLGVQARVYSSTQCQETSTVVGDFKVRYAAPSGRKVTLHYGFHETVPSVRDWFSLASGGPLDASAPVVQKAQGHEIHEADFTQDVSDTSPTFTDRLEFALRLVDASGKVTWDSAGHSFGYYSGDYAKLVDGNVPCQPGPFTDLTVSKR